jgi:hypothetical protein
MASPRERGAVGGAPGSALYKAMKIQKTTKNLKKTTTLAISPGENLLQNNINMVYYFFTRQVVSA